MALRESEGNAEIADSILGSPHRAHRRRRPHLPPETPAIVPFTEFAVPLRYEDLLDAEPLNRPAAVTLVNEVEAWARDAITGGT